MQNEAIEVVVVTCNSADHIGPCVNSILAAGGAPLIVDNGSTDDTAKIVQSMDCKVPVTLTRQNLGYGKAMNWGFTQTSGDIVILSNPDVVFLEGSIRSMVAFLRRNPRIGVVAPQQMFPNRTWQRSYGNLPGIWSGLKDAIGLTTLHNAIRRGLWPFRFDRTPKKVSYLDGAVLAIRREAFLQVEGFDEEFFFYSEEADLCARLEKAGWGVLFFPRSDVIHVRGASSPSLNHSERLVRQMVKSQFLLARKHLPSWKVPVYTRLQICHFVRLGLFCRLLQSVRGESAANSRKMRMFDSYVKAWKELLSPRLARKVAPEGVSTEGHDSGSLS